MLRVGVGRGTGEGLKRQGVGRDVPSILNLRGVFPSPKKIK